MTDNQTFKRKNITVKDKDYSPNRLKKYDRVFYLSSRKWGK